MMYRKQLVTLLFVIGGLLVPALAAGSVVYADPVTPEPGTPDQAAQEPTPAPTPTGLLDEVISTRTPEPTNTPDVIAEQVERFTDKVGLDVTVLGLGGADWINVGVSLLYVVAGYLLGTLLIKRLLPRLVKRTATEFDDQSLEAIGSDVRWLVVVLALSFATQRLVFIGADLKLLISDVYYVVGLLLVVRIAYKVIGLANEWAMRYASEQGRDNQIEPLVVLCTRVGQVLVALSAATILLSHFGVNITGLATLLGFAGLAISLAAQDTIADAIAGFIVLVDQPFRIGDRIEIQGENTWGDVVDIGLRTTRIRTRDNRLVIVPNSTISTNQVVNYSYPDPQYRIQTHVGIGYGTDVEKARRVLIDTVRQVHGVLPDKPVDALYNEMGESAMIFRVRWWIESYADTRVMFDQVHTALQHALDEAGIDCPFPTQTLNLQVDPQAQQGPLDQARLLPGAKPESDNTIDRA